MRTHMGRLFINYKVPSMTKAYIGTLHYICSSISPDQQSTYRLPESLRDTSQLIRAVTTWLQVLVNHDRERVTNSVPILFHYSSSIPHSHTHTYTKQR